MTAALLGLVISFPACRRTVKPRKSNPSSSLTQPLWVLLSGLGLQGVTVPAAVRRPAMSSNVGVLQVLWVV
ncbi:MAG: hypothetical protein WAL50_12510, partial [Kineosporiaceae bacterium]